MIKKITTVIITILCTSMLLGVYAEETLPTCIDLSDDMPKPGYQSRQNSCSAWAAAYAYKSYQEKQEHGWEYTDEHLFSPAYVFNQLNGGKNSGIMPKDALKLIVEQGCTTLADMPYNWKGFKKLPTKDQKKEASKYKAESYKAFPKGDVEALKTHLATKDPLIIGIPIYDDFNKIGPDNEIYDDISGKYHYGHTVCLVGYDDDKQAFKFMNSFGAKWGLDGFGWISYDIIKKRKLIGYAMEDVIDDSRKVYEAEKYDYSKGIKIENFSEDDSNIGYINNGDYIGYKKIDLNNLKKITVEAASNLQGGQIEVRLDKPNCELVTTLSVKNTGGWQTWVNSGKKVDDLSGTKDVYFVIKGGEGFLFNVNKAIFIY